MRPISSAQIAAETTIRSSGHPAAATSSQRDDPISLGHDAQLDPRHEPAGPDTPVELLLLRRPSGGNANAATGLVSVIPQPWITITS